MDRIELFITNSWLVNKRFKVFLFILSILSDVKVMGTPSQALHYSFQLQK
jgi:hypothetical protein